MTIKSSDRPSLYSDLPRSEETGDIFRLLDALDQTPSVHCYGRRIAFVLLVLIAAAVLALSGQLLIRRPLLIHADKPIAQRPKLHVAPGIAPAAAPVAAPAVEAQAATAGNVASIVYEDSGRATAADVNGGEPMQKAAGGSASAAAGTIDEGDGHHDASKPRGSGTTAIVAAKSTREGAPKHAGKQADKHAAKRAHAGTRRTRPRVPAHMRDGDVDLIAALLSRVSHADAVRKRSVSSAVGAKPVAAVKPAVPERHKSPVPNRDIVVPRPGEALASLVQRCRALGVVEGELCRIRICSGNWGKDPACATSSTAAPN